MLGSSVGGNEVMEAKDVRYGRRYTAMIDGKRIGITIGERISQEPPTWECTDDSGRRTFVRLDELIEPARYLKRPDRSGDDQSERSG